MMIRINRIEYKGSITVSFIEKPFILKKYTSSSLVYTSIYTIHKNIQTYNLPVWQAALLYFHKYMIQTRDDDHHRCHKRTNEMYKKKKYKISEKRRSDSCKCIHL